MIDLVSSRVSRAFGSEGAYSDAVLSVNKFNTRLLRERRLRLRLPFVDSQTHIIQAPTQNHLWKQPTQRLLAVRQDQVACYARKQWHKRRPNPPSVSSSSAALASTTVNGSQESIFTSSTSKTSASNGVTPGSNDEDPRVIMRAGELGKFFLIP